MPYQIPSPRFLKLSLTIAGFLIFAGAVPARADCIAPQNEAETTKCLGQDLTASDQHINETYQKLRSSLSDADKLKLRDQQRAWLKDRASVCHIDDKEPDRQKWMATILKEPAKAVCVTRFTKDREAVLNASLQSNTVQAAPDESHGIYSMQSKTTHRTGKWYFEVNLDTANIAKRKEVQFSIGILQPDGTGGMTYLVSIRPGKNATGSHVIGIGIDLDAGEIYDSADGKWIAEPGSSGGNAVKLNHEYAAALGASTDMADLTRDSLVKTNFGGGPFVYAVPAGYRPFGE